MTISLPDNLEVELEKRLKAEGFQSREDYLLDLIRSDVQRAGIEKLLEERVEGPFEPLESNWKDIVRNTAKRRG